MTKTLGVLLLPALLGAQQKTRACVPPNTPDSVNAVVTARLTPFDTTQRLGSAFTDLMLQEIGTRYRAPLPFVLSTYIGTDSIDGRKVERRAFAGAYAMFAITAHRGTIKSALAMSTGVPALDKSFIDAINSIGTDSAVPPLPEALQGKRLELRLRIGTSLRPDSDQTRLFRVRVPLATLSHEAAPGPRRPGLEYPFELRKADIEGSVHVQFVIGEDGAPVQGSLRIVRATHVLFAQAVAEFIPKMRYQPARIAGCPVPLAVTQPFDFSLHR